MPTFATPREIEWTRHRRLLIEFFGRHSLQRRLELRRIDGHANLIPMAFLAASADENPAAEFEERAQFHVRSSDTSWSSTISGVSTLA